MSRRMLNYIYIEQGGNFIGIQERSIGSGSNLVSITDCRESKRGGGVTEGPDLRGEI